MVEIALGNQAQHHRVLHIDMRTECARQPDPINLVSAEMLHEQFRAGMQRSLRQLNRTYVVLRDVNRRIAVVQDIGTGTSILDDACRFRGMDLAVGTQDAGQEHLTDDFDDARATNAGDLLHLVTKRRIIGPKLGTDDPEAGLVRFLVDTDALNGTWRSSLPPADLGTLESRASWGRCREQSLRIANENLRIRSNIDHSVKHRRDPAAPQPATRPQHRRLHDPLYRAVHKRIRRDECQGQCLQPVHRHLNPWPGRTAPCPAPPG